MTEIKIVIILDHVKHNSDNLQLNFKPIKKSFCYFSMLYNQDITETALSH